MFCLESKKFVVCIKSKETIYKIFTIIFYYNKTNGTSDLILSFPYNKNSKGLLSLATHPKNTIKLNKLSLIPGGLVTSHNVKFSHWLDGNVHFSEDGKIFTRIRKESDCLTTSIGHLFTIQAKGLKGFEIKKDQKKINKLVGLEFFNVY